MLVAMKRMAVAGSIAVGAMLAATLTVSTQSLPSCDPDNGGIKLPAGFCALVVADNIGPARHLAVAPNGDVFVALQTTGGRGAPPTGGGVVALRDTDRDGRLETQERFGSGSITGIALRNDYLYVAKFNSVERYKMAAGQLKPASDMPETVVKWSARRLSARRQGHRFRREGRTLRERRRAFERLSAAGSTAWSQG